MTEIDHRSPDEHTRSVSIALPSGPILIATDVTPASDAAFPLAQVIAAHAGADVHVVSVLGSFATSMYAFDGLPMQSVDDDALRVDREVGVREQLGRLVPSGTTWPITVRGGESTREIVDYAATLGARVIVTGRGRHGMIDRILGGEAVLRMLQLGDRPILAVEPGLTWLPRQVVIATDLSAHSVYAARVAMTMVAPDARVFLVNVGPVVETADQMLRLRALSYREQARVHFSELRQMLGQRDIRFEDVLLTGNVADELVRFAETSQADLLVSATHGYGFVRRLLLGSVASVLVRAASCSVLCVPGSARATALSSSTRVETNHTRRFAAGTLDTELAAFAKRHVGARCGVTVHTPEFGAQVLGSALTLVGATFDPHARVASVMFGAPQLAGAHLTHSIAHVSEVDLSSDLEGRDRVLRLVHGAGYTLITIE